jgi:hypothetical protein
MISVKSVLQQGPDPRGKQGLQHPLEALLGLILLSMLSGRKGMRAAFRLGRSLSRRPLNMLGFRRDLASPCHATFTELLRVLDPDALAKAFSQFTTEHQDCEGDETMLRQRSIDGKTLRGSKNQTARPSMSSRRSAQRLANLWVRVHHEAKVLKYQTPCVYSKRST